MQAQAAKLAKCQPKTFHSPSTRPKTVQLTGGVTVVKVSGDAAGRRIVVTTDGGRVRLREKRRGKTKKGHKRFKPAWREPRLFMIYATDEHGKLDPAFSPIIDGSLGACDHLFRLLLSYLKALNVKEASKVLFIADGAKWIWNRVPTLIKSLGLTAEQTQQRIDYWHAVEYLGNDQQLQSHGIDSIACVHLMQTLSRRLGPQLPASLFLEPTTVNQLANRISAIEYGHAATDASTEFVSAISVAKPDEQQGAFKARFEAFSSRGDTRYLNIASLLLCSEFMTLT